MMEKKKKKGEKRATTAHETNQPSTRLNAKRGRKSEERKIQTSGEREKKIR